MAHLQTLGPHRYQARWQDPSGRERSKIFHKKSDATKHLVSVQHAILSGAYVDPAAGRMPVGVLAEQWIAGKVNLRPSTLARSRNILDVHVLPRWGSVQVSKVDHGSIQAWVAQLLASGASGASVRKIHGVLSGVLGLAVRNKRLPSNPTDGINLPRADKKSRKYLTADQVAKLAEEAATVRAGRPQRHTDENFAQYRLVVYILAYCGLRWSELAALKVRRVDLIRRRIHIAEAVTDVDGRGLTWGTPKSHESRWVPVPGFLAEYLTMHLDGRSADELVFTAPEGGVLRNRNARRAWFDRASSAIGVEGLTPHELRHTSASLAVSAGANVKAVQRMLGHASAAKALDTYADLFDDDLDAVADRLDVVARNAFAAQTESRGNLASVTVLEPAL